MQRLDKQGLINHTATLFEPLQHQSPNCSLNIEVTWNSIKQAMTDAAISLYLEQEYPKSPSQDGLIQT